MLKGVPRYNLHAEPLHGALLVDRHAGTEYSQQPTSVIRYLNKPLLQRSPSRLREPSPCIARRWFSYNEMRSSRLSEGSHRFCTAI